MLMVLLGAGIGLLVVGLGALGYGIPYKEFGFGNTLIIAGAIAACSGLLMIGLWAVVRELQVIAQRLGGGASAALHSAFAAEPPVAPSLAPPPPFAQPAASAPADPAGAPAWVEDRGLGEVVPQADEAPPPKPRRNLLFTSSSRRERERAAHASEPLAPDMLSPDLRPNAPPAEPAAPTPPSFDDAWPKSERGRRAGRPAGEADAPPAAAAREERPQVTVLKSGVVDGMAYSLYSDGSIEAQMPEGMMRFASIDELRAHLDQRP
jgi:hypothetical protein